MKKRLPVRSSLRAGSWHAVSSSRSGSRLNIGFVRYGSLLDQPVPRPGAAGNNDARSLGAINVVRKVFGNIVAFFFGDTELRAPLRDRLQNLRRLERLIVRKKLGERLLELLL